MKLQQAREAALALPGTSEQPHFDATSFRVGGRIFATAPPEGTHLHVFVDEDIRAPLIDALPQIYEPLRWGARVIGLRIVLAKAPAGVVRRLLHEAWLKRAGAKLIAQLPPGAA